jgi:hypothetical protein
MTRTVFRHRALARRSWIGTISDNESTRFARGCVLGIILSLPVWAVLALAVWAVWAVT